MQAPGFISKLLELRGSPSEEHTFNPTGLVFKNMQDKIEEPSSKSSPKGDIESPKGTPKAVFQKGLYNDRVLKILQDAQASIDKEYPAESSDELTQKITHFLLTQREKYKSLQDNKKEIQELSWLFFAKNDSEEALKLLSDLKDRFILINQPKIRLEKLHAVFCKFIEKNKLCTKWTEDLSAKFHFVAGSLYPETFFTVFKERAIHKKTKQILMWAVGGNTCYTILEGIIGGKIYPSLLRPITQESFTVWKLKRLTKLGKFYWREKKEDIFHIDTSDPEQVRRCYYVEDKVIQPDININGIPILGDSVEAFLKHLFQVLVDCGYAKEIGESLENFKKDIETPFHKILRASTISSLSFCEMTLRSAFPLLYNGRIFGFGKKRESKIACQFYVKSSRRFSCERLVTYTLYQKKTIQDWSLADAKPIGEVQIIWTLKWNESQKNKIWNGTLKLDKITFFDVDPLIKKEAIDILWEGLADCRDPELMHPLKSKAQSLTSLQPLATPQGAPGL